MAERKRVRSTPKHRTLKLSRTKLKQPKPLPGIWSLLKQTVLVIKNNWTLFFGIALINLVISALLVQGLSSFQDIEEVKSELEEVFTDQNKLGNAAALFGYLLSSTSGTTNEGGAVYQFFTVVIISLAVIWGTRQVLAGEVPKIRETFYKGMYPLIPFILVLIVIGLQLLPLLLGSLIYSTVVNNSLAATPAETILWILLFAILALLSAYMLASSIFALYVSTLPDMTPLKALRSARELVLHRRLGIWVRFLILPLVIFILSAVVFIPILIVAPIVAQLLFMVAASLSLVVLHIYMYLLYRSLL